MAYIFILLGLILIIATFRNAWSQALEKEVDNRHKQSMIHMDSRLGDLENKLAALAGKEFLFQDNTTDSLGAQMEVLHNELTKFERKLDSYREKEVNSEVLQKVDFKTHFKDAEKESLFNDIREAYASGKSITRLAQEYEKGKGEIELILNLQR